MVPLVWPMDGLRELAIVRQVSQSQWPTEVLQHKISPAIQKAESPALTTSLLIVSCHLQIITGMV